MPAPFARRLAGIRFVQQPPQLSEKLPRMDIAVFVGFAAAGPLHRPIVVEDAAQFAAIFGDDLPLAWDRKKGSQTNACLGAAVRGFFGNGGRRCWVIRVAGTDDAPPETSLFPLPGLVRVDGEDLHPAFARARSAGSWFDALWAATSLSVRGIAVLGWDAPWKTILVRVARQDDLRPGDLLRLRFADTREESFFAVESIAAATASPPDSGRGRVAAEVEYLGTLREAGATTFAGEILQATWERGDGGTSTAPANVILPENSPPDADDPSVKLDVPQGFSPPPGTLLELSWTDSNAALRKAWFQVEHSETSLKSPSMPGGNAALLGRAFFWTDNLPAAAASDGFAAERLTFELRIQRGENNAADVADLGFIGTQPRFWNALPDDLQLFSEAAPEIYEALWREAEQLRFPLAGSGDREARFIPFNMSALGDPAMGPQHSGRSPLERNGLDNFSSALFLDQRLLDSDVSTLIADADFVRYQTPGTAPLRGIHAALEIEEASLIAVPDAVSSSWHAVPATPAAPPLPSEPRLHPSWWHFLECDPPASPPAAEKPNHGEFLKCDLRELKEPDLWVSGHESPMALAVKLEEADSFILEWSAPDPDAEFILEEATEPDFADAVELWRGRRTSYTILSRPAGAFYYRVRAQASGESSNWSNGVVVERAGDTRWELNPAEDFTTDTLLEIHRALLRVCAARADIMAVLALPEHFAEDDALAYVGDLKSSRPPAGNWIVRPLDSGEEPAFSYAAVYHPWLLVREAAGDSFWTPPDGAAAGLIAARSIASGAWIAPANKVFAGVVSLAPRFNPDRYLELLLAQINLIRQEPRGFIALSADTLSLNEELRPINVRRLLILLRRAALRLGATFVSEPNDGVLRRIVRGAFESIMQQLFVRGAFAGTTAATSYQVVTDETLNTPNDFDNGRFRVDLKVAPALPMSFLTVRLVQMGERATATEII
jgi:hypothetical protein